MTDGRIYLLNQEPRLIPMSESPYDSESLLQQLWASHSDLLQVFEWADQQILTKHSE